MRSVEKGLPRDTAPTGRRRREPLRRGAFALLAAGVLAMAPLARADPVGVSVEGFGGWQHLRPSTSGVGSAISGSEGTAIFGGDVLVRLGGLGLGLAADKTVSGSAKPWAGSAMAGFLFDLPLGLRVDALGEVGRRAPEFGDLFRSSGATFVGLRPGVSFQLGPSPVRLGITGLARWPTSGGSFGSPDYGIVGRVGLEL
jgi:hypothetical protein